MKKQQNLKHHLLTWNIYYHDEQSSLVCTKGTDSYQSSFFFLFSLWLFPLDFMFKNWLSDVKYHLIFDCDLVKKCKVKVAQLCLTLCNPMDHSPQNSPGQNTGVGSLSLLQGIFPNPGLNPGLPHCGRILYQLSHTQKCKEHIIYFLNADLLRSECLIWFTIGDIRNISLFFS